jgi:hypothetical protein
MKGYIYIASAFETVNRSICGQKVRGLITTHTFGRPRRPGAFAVTTFARKLAKETSSFSSSLVAADTLK